jgi:hypothetical protein
MAHLQLDFEGFFQCRLATDPDPPSERRGISGYTFAFGCESDLSQHICLQRDEIPDQDFRQPFPPYLQSEDPPFGVFVKAATVDGRPHDGSPLVGQPVRLLDGPVYELRNQIVADGFNRIAPVIDPFEIQIGGEPGGPLLRRRDPLDPEHPEIPIWALRPEQYERRVPTNFYEVGSEVLKRCFDEELGGDFSESNVNAFYNAYFERRQEYLELRITELEARRRDPAAPRPRCPYEVDIQAARSRIFAIDEHTAATPDDPPGRMENRLGIQTVWRHTVVGRGVAENVPGGTVSLDEPWQVRFWHGGWDGDLLVGYMAGWLRVPFTPY